MLLWESDMGPVRILALDQGTSSSSAFVFDAAGEVLGTASRTLPQIYPIPGWVEHDPELIWRTQIESAREALAIAGVEPHELSGIGIANQRETTLVWDRATGRPTGNAIVWQCRRTTGICEQLIAEGAAPEILRRTGLMTDAYFSGTKLRWLLDSNTGLREEAESGRLAFGTVDSWLIWRLTGGARHVTDVTNASRTMLFNLRSLDWDPEMLRLLAVPPAVLPQVQSSSSFFGETAEAVFGARVPIFGVAGDQQAALFGQACLKPGMAKNTYGTGSFLLLNTGEQLKIAESGLVTTVGIATQEGVRYALEGSVFVAGAAVQWLRDGLGLIGSAEEIERLALEVESSDGVYIVPAFTGLGAPHWDMRARGAIFGLTRGSTRAHLARAVLEAIALQTRDVVDAMAAESGVGLLELRVDGGASRNNLLMQIQADILGSPVVRSQHSETTALGAAWLAGLGARVWSTEAEVASQWRADRVFEPTVSESANERFRGGWRRAVERAKDWLNEDTSGGPV
jgi:glycerol kinase